MGAASGLSLHFHLHLPPPSMPVPTAHLPRCSAPSFTCTQSPTHTGED